MVNTRAEMARHILYGMSVYKVRQFTDWVIDENARNPYGMSQEDVEAKILEIYDAED